MKRLADMLEHPVLYRAWMAPFAEQKFRPVARNSSLATVERVLDVGCGPGTNAGHFAHTKYTGVDLNPRYIASAQRRHGGQFLVADVTSDALDLGQFDFILLNSLLHHLDDAEVDRLLQSVGALLTAAGHVHVIDLILPERRSIARRLALLDRGEYPRSLQQWEGIFGKHFECVQMEAFPVRGAGLDLWQMVYFKGRARRSK